MTDITLTSLVRWWENRQGIEFAAKLRVYRRAMELDGIAWTPMNLRDYRLAVGEIG